jgi:hypothetical protein
MRLPSIERLASGLRQAPHEYRPSLGVFPDISVDAIARDVKVVEKGKESGKLELPTSSSGSLDETEYAIIERIFSDRKAAHHTLLDQLTTCTERLTALDFHGRFTIIQNAAPAAVSEFGTEARQGRDELYRLRRTLLEHEQERDDFKSYNRLRRAPRLSSPVTKFFKVSFLVFLFVSETYINAVFLAKGNALGFIGGAAEALVFATLNSDQLWDRSGRASLFKSSQSLGKSFWPTVVSRMDRICGPSKPSACSLSRSVRCPL